MSNEVPMISAWVYGRIVGDSVLQAGFTARSLNIVNQVWEYRAPEGVQTPWIIYQRQSGGDVTSLEGVRIYARGNYLIRVVGTGEDWDHEDIANRLDVLFGRVVNQVVTTPPGVILACVRTEAFDLPEDVGGVQYRHLGGLYGIAAQAA